MQKSIFLFWLVFLCSVSIFGQVKSDYSGVWTFDTVISHPDDKLRTAAVRMSVTQTPTEIKIETVRNDGLQGNAAQNSNTAATYPFGKETTAEIESSRGKTPVKLKAELTGKGKLNLSSTQTFKTSDSEVSIKIKESFEKSADGKFLKVIREIQNSKAVPIIEVFVAEKQSSENTLSGNNSVLDVVDLKSQFPQAVLNGKARHLEVPSYPAGASANRVTGSIPVRIIFDEEGNVVFAQAIYGHPALKSAAIESAMKCKFEPIEVGGKPVKVSGIILYDFRPR